MYFFFKRLINHHLSYMNIRIKTYISQVLFAIKYNAIEEWERLSHRDKMCKKVL